MDHHQAGSGDHRSLYPIHRSKTIHLVRHAQGIHNVASKNNHDALLSYEYFDAYISPLGWEQVDSLRKHVQACGLSNKIDLVITSPLLRTMQTAVGVFGGEAVNSDIVEAPNLMIENAVNSDRKAITSLNCPPFIALEFCRERLGLQPCNKRRSVREYQSIFPAIDFSLIESDDDILWTPDVRETIEELAARGMRFFNWLWTRKEKEIAIVTHDRFLSYTLSALSTDSDWHPSLKTEICREFKNCELRSLVIYDQRNLIEFDSSSTTNYPGNIPQSLDLPE